MRLPNIVLADYSITAHYIDMKKRKLTVRFTVDLPGDLHKRFKVHCVTNDLDMTEVVRKLISDYVKRGEARANG